MPRLLASYRTVRTQHWYFIYSVRRLRENLPIVLQLVVRISRSTHIADGNPVRLRTQEPIMKQKLNPAPTDPMQAKIFMFFPLFLTIILAPFPAGLVIYWTINNVLTMAQQLFIMKRTKVKTI